MNLFETRHSHISLIGSRLDPLPFGMNNILLPSVRSRISPVWQYYTPSPGMMSTSKPFGLELLWSNAARQSVLLDP